MALLLKVELLLDDRLGDQVDLSLSITFSGAKLSLTFDWISVFWVSLFLGSKVWF